MSSSLQTSTWQRIESLTAAGLWGQHTVHDLLAERSAELPDLLAVADPPNRESLVSGTPLRLSFSELDRASDNLAADFLQGGIVSGDALLVQLPNICELVVTYYACSKIGAVISPLPVQYGAHEIALAAKVLKPKAVITLETFKETSLAAIVRSALGAATAVWTFDGDDQL